MKVYRLCRKNEIDEILNSREYKDVGQNFQEDEKKNNFKYSDGIKYLHFFKDKSSILYLNPSKDRYICCYDIPSSLLEQHSGIGKYWDFVNFDKLMSVSEYAIEANLVKFEYLKQVDKIILDIEYEDYFEDSTLKGFIENIYNKENFSDGEQDQD